MPMLPNGQIAITATGPNPVIGAIQQAAVKTGSDFEYLLTTAMRESGLKPDAKSRTSSATGLFQFIDQTWLGAIKQFGERYGLGRYAESIARTARGLYNVASAELRSEILALRKDAGLSALMAGETANQAKQALENRLGREVSCGELYVAHFLGQGGACRLIEAYEKNPDGRAASLFPAAARANRNIFYNANGAAKTVAEVYASLSAEPDAPVPMPPPVLRAPPVLRTVPELRTASLPSPTRAQVPAAQPDGPAANAGPRDLLTGYNLAAVAQPNVPAIAAAPAIAAKYAFNAPILTHADAPSAANAPARPVSLPAEEVVVAARFPIPQPKPTPERFGTASPLAVIPQPPVVLTAQMMELFAPAVRTLSDEREEREERPGPLVDAAFRPRWEQSSTA